MSRLSRSATGVAAAAGLCAVPAVAATPVGQMWTGAEVATMAEMHH
jgi:hypothetical protein